MSEPISCVLCARAKADVPAVRYVFHLSHFQEVGTGPVGLYSLDLCEQHAQMFWALFKPYVQPHRQIEIGVMREAVWLPEIGRAYCLSFAESYARVLAIEPGRPNKSGVKHTDHWIIFENWSKRGIEVRAHDRWEWYSTPHRQRAALHNFVKRYGTTEVRDTDINPHDKGNVS